MTALEAQLLFARVLLLIVLYTFLGAVALFAWRDLRAGRDARRYLTTQRSHGARLILLDGGNSQLAPGTVFAADTVTTLGRAIDNDIVLLESSISNHHAVFFLRDGTWWVEDLGSTNGTLINHIALDDRAPAIARSGDLLQVGAVKLRLVASET